jgi:protein ImuB
MFRPEPVDGGDLPRPAPVIRWRRRDLRIARATGPERLAPEWWLDDPAWRSGPRDYWRVETDGGERLWLFYAHGGAVSGGWFCQGLFA